MKKSTENKNFNCKAGKAMLQPKTTYMGLYLFKDNKKVAALDISNYSATNMSLIVSTISSVRVEPVGVEILVEGIPVADITESNIAEHFPGTEVGNNYFELKNADDFRIFAFMEDGELAAITCSDAQA